MNNKVADVITSKVIEMLNNGIIPWQKPWVGGMWPTSMNSNKPYHGVNVWTLNATADLKGFSSNLWITFNQAAAMGGTVRKGEHGAPIIFFQAISAHDPAHEDKTIPYMKYSTVFNCEQVDGIAIPEVDTPRAANVVDKAEAIITGMINPPAIAFEGSRACYRPRLDKISLPAMDKFYSTAGYYSTAFHELAHSTGHPSRLHRFEIDAATSREEYSKEELVAEMSAAMMMNHAGMLQDGEISASASYIAHWTEALKRDVSLVIKAGSAAQKAFDYIAPGC